MNVIKLQAVAAVFLAAFGITAGHAADYNFRLHTLVKSPHPYNDMAAYMKADLEKKSGGRIAIKIFDAGQLGKDPAVISEMGLGTIDLMISTTNNAVKQVPEYGIFSMPYLFGGMDDVMAKVGPGTPVEAHFQKVYADRKVGMKLLALGASGTRNLSNSVKPVNALADIKGFKMRTPPSTMISKSWEALGTLPVSVAWGELYAAMQTKVADALESSLPGYTGSKLYEVAPYLALTAHTIQVNHISMSKATWDKLPPDLQKMVLASAIDATKHGVMKAKGYDSNLVEKLKKEHGVTVTKPDVAEFQAVLKPVQTDLAKELDLTEELDLIRSK
jgi:tripartite ATP-independent transporter DctP family solute receptor